jgi:insulysin
MSQLLKFLSNPNHPYHLFGTGNKSTLSHATIRDTLIQHYVTHYSPQKMNVVVYGRESLDVLTTWVTEKFGSICQNRSIHEMNSKRTSSGSSSGSSSIEDTNIPILNDEHNRKIIWMKSLKDLRTMNFFWVLSDQRPNYRIKVM